MTRHQLRTTALLLGCCLLAGTLATACAREDLVHGYIPDEEALQRVRPGTSTRASVGELMGSPTAAAGFKDETWYYITQRAEQVAFLRPDVKARDVIAITFDADGIVADVRRYTLEDGREIAFNDRTTPTRGKELTVLEQFFGNLGRFSKSPEERR